MRVKFAMLVFAVSTLSAFGESSLICDFSQPGSREKWECHNDRNMLQPSSDGGAEVTYRKFVPEGYEFPAIVTKPTEALSNWTRASSLELDLRSPLGKELDMVIELRNQDGRKYVLMFPKGTLTSTARQKVCLPLPQMDPSERIKELHLYMFKPAADKSYVIYRISLNRTNAAETLAAMEKTLSSLPKSALTGSLQLRLKELRQAVGNATQIPDKTEDAITELSIAVTNCQAIEAGKLAAQKLPATIRLPVTTPAPLNITTRDGRKMRLVWADEFNATGLPDAKEWDYEVGFVRNNERQYYTRARQENVTQQNGCLLITAQKEKFPNPNPHENKDNLMDSKKEAEYTAASIYSKRGWSHGRMEVRAIMPYGRGLWPAIWMMGTNFPTVNWPQCGEIDILEYLGADPNIANCGIHVKNGYRNEKNPRLNWSTNGQYQLNLPEFIFHVYALEWDAKQLTILIDDQPKLTVTRADVEKKSGSPWPFDLPLYLILNTAVGGDWGGKSGIDNTVFPAVYRIDYVRVYQD